MRNIHSYDIFDTLITRITYTPAGIFDLMAEKLLKTENMPLIAGRFKSCRMKAERVADRMHGVSTTIDDIYKILGGMLNLKQNEIEILKSLEMDMEYAASEPLLDMLKEAEAMAVSGARVIFISDMYLSADFIRKLIAKHSSVLKDFPIYVSCECGCNKSSGTLYRYVSEKEGIVYSDWIHTGDNISSDVNIPRLLGIQTVLVKETVCNKIGSYVLNRIEDQNDAAVQLYGKLLSINATKSTAYNVGYYQAGPIWYAYICWIMEVCKDRGIRRLFFIARDGYVLKKIADTIIAKNGFDIATSYIYGSRSAWRVDSEDDRSLVKAYMKQEFGDDYGNLAFVDSQGTGLSCDYVADIAGCDFPVFLYNYVKSEGKHRCELLVYSDFNGKYDILEAICRAPHGTTQGYVRREGGVCPVLEDEEHTTEDYVLIEECCNGSVQFTGDYENACFQIGFNPDISRLSTEIYNIMCTDPGDDTAEYLGELVHSSGNEKNKKFAPLIKAENIEQIILDKNSYKGEDLMFSLYRSDEHTKKIYEQKYYELLHSDIIPEKAGRRVSVVIYGAGQRGKKAFMRYNLSEKVEVTGWVDAGFEGLMRENLPVTDPLKIKLFDYDYVVIAVAAGIDMVRYILKWLGVDESKIITDTDFDKKFERQYKDL